MNARLYLARTLRSGNNVEKAVELIKVRHTCGPLVSILHCPPQQIHHSAFLVPSFLHARNAHSNRLGVSIPTRRVLLLLLLLVVVVVVVLLLVVVVRARQSSQQKRTRSNPQSRSRQRNRRLGEAPVEVSRLLINTFDVLGHLLLLLFYRDALHSCLQW